MEGEFGKKIETGGEAIETNFEERIKGIEALYAGAVEEEQYLKVMEEAKELEGEMRDAGRPEEEIAPGIIKGLWAEYYRTNKFAKSADNIESVSKKVSGHYSKIENPKLKVEYGYLLATITSELKEEPDEAEKILKEIQEIAEKEKDIVSALRVLTARGLARMKTKNYDEAVAVFDEIENFEDIPKEAFLHAGNVCNNRGAAKIRGNIDIVGGAKDLVTAADYYLQMDPPSRKHFVGIRNRLKEAKEKLDKR